MILLHLLKSPNHNVSIQNAIRAMQENLPLRILRSNLVLEIAQIGERISFRIVQL